MYDDVGDGELCFIVSEFVEGGSLGDHLVNARLTQERAVRWVAEVADALAFAHRNGVVHQDVKPGNVLIDDHGRALLADFGIARAGDQAETPAPPTGTLRYMSPEQLAGREVDGRSDVYGLGVVLHELLTGRLPYSSADPAVLRREIAAGVTLAPAPGLPAGLKRICQKALGRDPAARYPSAANLAADLRRNPSGPAPQRTMVVVAGAVLLVALAGVFAWQLGKSGPPLAVTVAEPAPTPAFEPVVKVDDAWVAHVGSLPIGEQAGAVVEKLKTLNPGYDGDVRAEQFGGAVALLEMRTDKVADISPLKALRGLRFLNVSGTYTWKANGLLADLSPLAGLRLEELSVSGTQVSDLSPLAGMPLNHLVVNNTPVKDIAPLRGLPLTRLDLHNTPVTGLEPLAGMRLVSLHLANTKAADLAPLRGMPLREFNCQYSGVSDLGPLKAMPLDFLQVHGNPITSLEPLRGSPVASLNVRETKVADWSALATMPNLKVLSLDFVAGRDAEVLRPLKSLREINARPATDFWRSVEKPK